MLQQWDKRGKTEMIAARPREVKNLPRIQNRGRAGSESQATPDKAHASLFAKQERPDKDEGPVQERALLYAALQFLPEIPSIITRTKLLQHIQSPKASHTNSNR